MMIHLAIAEEIKKKLSKKSEEFFLGTIAPDLGRLMGISKITTHFQNDDDCIPVLKKFLDKYKVDNDFFLGYYIHLYTDYLWFKYFIPEVRFKDSIVLLNGEKVICDDELYLKFIYNDYTNLNAQLMDLYNLNLSMFYKPVNIPSISMDELPLSKLQFLLDKSREFLESSKEQKNYLLDIESIKNFINFSADVIYSDIKK